MEKDSRKNRYRSLASTHTHTHASTHAHANTHTLRAYVRMYYCRHTTTLLGGLVVLRKFKENMALVQSEASTSASGVCGPPLAGYVDPPH